MLTAAMERVAWRLCEMRDPAYLDDPRTLINVRNALAPMNPVIVGSIPEAATLLQLMIDVGVDAKPADWLPGTVETIDLEVAVRVYASQHLPANRSSEVWLEVSGGTIGERSFTLRQPDAEGRLAVPVKRTGAGELKLDITVPCRDEIFLVATQQTSLSYPAIT
jgi:hypothetical protein